MYYYKIKSTEMLNNPMNGRGVVCRDIVPKTRSPKIKFFLLTFSMNSSKIHSCYVIDQVWTFPLSLKCAHNV